MSLKNTLENNPAIVLFVTLFSGFGCGVATVSYLESREVKQNEYFIANLEAQIQVKESKITELNASIDELKASSTPDKSTSSIPDLKSLNKEEAGAITRKLMDLTGSDPLGDSLRNMVNASLNPFGPLDITLHINLEENPSELISKDLENKVVAACPGSPTNSYSIIILKSWFEEMLPRDVQKLPKDKDNPEHSIIGLESFLTYTRECPSDVHEQDMDYEIWADKSYFENLFRWDLAGIDLITTKAQLEVNPKRESKQ